MHQQLLRHQIGHHTDGMPIAPVVIAKASPKHSNRHHGPNRHHGVQ